MPKGTSRAEATLNSEKIKPVALAVIELCLTEGIRQSVRRKLLDYFFKFHGNFLKAYWVDLKPCLGLVLPIQYYHHHHLGKETGFQVILLHGPRHSLL